MVARFCAAVAIIAWYVHAVPQHPEHETRLLSQRSLSIDEPGLMKPPARLPFKMPKIKTDVDSMAKATHGYCDWFVVIYWSVILVIMVAYELLTQWRGGIPLAHFRSKLTESDLETQPSLARRTSTGALSEMPIGLSTLEQDSIMELAANFWTLNIQAARGVVRTKSSKHVLSPLLVFFAALAMGCLQLFTLGLICYDIDPSADPYTVNPAAAWKTSPFTVNCMKVCMTFFLGMSVVAEAGDAYLNYIIATAVPYDDGEGNQGLIVHRGFVCIIPLFHYTITLAVILVGVSVVLSCQAVPDILYNSMAILFITQVDELFWGFFEKLFDIEVTWTVPKDVLSGKKNRVLKRCLILFPMLWGFCLLGRAWYREEMPILVFRVIANSF